MSHAQGLHPIGAQYQAGLVHFLLRILSDEVSWDRNIYICEIPTPWVVRNSTSLRLLTPELRLFASLLHPYPQFLENCRPIPCGVFWSHCIIIIPWITHHFFDIHFFFVHADLLFVGPSPTSSGGIPAPEMSVKVFSCALMLEKWAVFVELHESINVALCAPRLQLLIQLFRHGLREIFCHGQTNLKPVKFQRESWKTMEGHDVWEYWSQDLDWTIFGLIWMLPQTSFQAATNCTFLCKLPEWTRQPARWKPPCMVQHGIVVQQLNSAPFMV